MAQSITISQLFQPVVLTTAAAALYTAPTSPSSTVLINGRVRFANTTANTVTVTAYAVPFGGTPAVGNCICNAESLAPNSHLDLDVPVLSAGGSLDALASANTSVTASALAGTLVVP